jgi:hypothetical protein
LAGREARQRQHGHGQHSGGHRSGANPTFVSYAQRRCCKKLQHYILGSNLASFEQNFYNVKHTLGSLTRTMQYSNRRIGP